MSILVYDTEIVNCIPNKKKPNLPDVKYCKGWTDFKGMGLSCCCVFNEDDNESRVFLKDNLDDLQGLIDRSDYLVGFNSDRFDRPLLDASGINSKNIKHYDILQEVLSRLGLASNQFKGRSLSAFAKANDIEDKSGSGALAPVKWQRGEYGAVIDYCMHDVWITTELLILGLAGDLIDPKTRKKIQLRKI